MTLVRFGVSFIIALLCIPLGLASTIQGTVYDDSLDPVNKAIIHINTEPEQTYVSVNGTYVFYSVPSGEYILEATYIDFDKTTFLANESVKVSTEGTFVIDLVLFESLEEDLELGEDIGIDIDEVAENGEKKPNIIVQVAILVGMFILVGLGMLYVYLTRKQPEEKEAFVQTEKKKKDSLEDTDEELSNIENFIKTHKRITQKEIRQEIPLSEAKISLVISQLESEGKIKKIKKGRGNIIVWNNEN